jgi:predicted metal-dependent phosphoesterase TrpH
MPAPDFDLQSHSTHSDGALPPAEVVALAASQGVKLLALSDHDTVDGVDEALAAGREHGIAVVPATELSSVHDVHEDLHVLGYGLDHSDPGLLAQLADYRADRERRIWAMADRLRELGFVLNTEELERRAAAGQPLGRPHLARALLSQPGNWGRLEKERIAGPDELFPAYLVPGAPAYVARERPTVGDAIELIHAHGGVAIWAHPYWDLEETDAVLAAAARFVELGLDGIEVFYPTHDQDQAKELHEFCGERGLLMTGSTDFHGPGHDRFSRFLNFDLHGLEPRLGPIDVRS